MFFKRRNSNKRITILLLLPLFTGIILWGCDSVTSSEQEEIDEDLDSTELKGELRDSGILLSWKSITSADTYDLYRSQDTTEQDSSDIYASGISDTTYTDTNVQSDSTYYYQIRPVAEDQAGPTSNKIKITNFTVDPITTDRLVGTHYYLWWSAENNWTDRYTYQPILGNYGSRELQTINQHIKWALEHGIQWFSIGWVGPEHDATTTLEDHFLEAKLADKINFSILYETFGRLGDGPIDMNTTENRQQFRDDLEYMNENYFNRENYMYIDGEPVLFIYMAHALKENVGEAINNAIDEVGIDPYIIADIPSWASADVHPISEVADAITAYDPYTAGPEVESSKLPLYKKGMHRFHLSANQSQSSWDFMPVAIPGVHGTENTILDISPELFGNVLGFLRPHLGDAKATLITAFNDWSRNTMIEPSETFEGQYLDMTKNEIATGSTPPYEPPAGTKIIFDWGKSVAPTESNPNSNDKRKLSFLIQNIILKNATGETLRNYNIGNTNQEPLLINGIYGPESHDQRTWRWFGGYNSVSQLIARNTNNISTIEFHGRAIETMDVTIQMKGQSKTIDNLYESRNTYSISFE